MKRSTIMRMIRFWPPYLGAGINVRHIADDFMTIDVEMKLRPWNRNYVGTHFGGSLYAMTDPFFMMMLIENLGRDYIIWDKAANIRFKSPGRGRVSARFTITPERIAEIRAQADNGPKSEPVFNVQVVDEAGTVVADVEKTVYVRRKDRPANGGAKS